MVVFPNAKINLGLNVIEKRPDGFHNITSCFYPVPWYDALEVIKAKSFAFTTSGLSIPGKVNICVQAYELLKKDYILPEVSIHLHKNIPIGAGLGGGSADGAFMLKLLNDKFSLNISPTRLQTYAAMLGSDCSFFMENRPMYIEGKGDIFSPIDINLVGKYLAIIYPEMHIDTTAAYGAISPKKPEHHLKYLLETTPLSHWHESITNDFEGYCADNILAIKDQLYKEGAIYASMTGSGSAVFGIFSNKPTLRTTHTYMVARL